MPELSENLARIARSNGLMARLPKQNRCADTGYSGDKSEATMCAYHGTPHIHPRGEEKVVIQHGFKT